MSKLRQALTFLLLALIPGIGFGQVQTWKEIPNGQIRLLTSAGQGGDTALGVELHLDAGWKIYWEYAGPVGQPTVINATGLARGQTATFFFPWPKRDRLQGFPSYGYGGEILFPGLLTGAATGGQIQLSLAICSQTQCIPYRTTLDIPNDQSHSDLLVRSKIRQAFARVPRPVSDQPELNLNTATQEISLIFGDEGQFSDFLISPSNTKAAQDGFFLNTVHQATEGKLVAAYDIRDAAFSPSILAGARLFIDGAGGARVFDTRDFDAYARLAHALGIDEGIEGVGDSTSGPGAEIRTPDRSQDFDGSVISAAFFLFIGGVLLNIMPCVLPVLFLKMKAFAGIGEAGQRVALRRSFGWTAVGLIGTFLALGVVLSLIQITTGVQLTLGVWLQFPLTTIVLAALIILFIANAFGWFEFVVPASVVNVGAQRQGILGDILAGMVAALLGGACAGVLMAMALSVAFAQPTALMVLLLGIMGLGLALPYLLVALVPGAAQLIPKPGRWMKWLKPLIGFGLILTFSYLVLILLRQIQPAAVVACLVLSGLALLGLWWAVYRRQKLARWGGIGLLALMIGGAPFFALPADPLESSRDYAAEIDALVNDGQRVFVDVTALWCATCQTNKILVMNTKEIKDLFAQSNIKLFTINADTLWGNVSDFMAAQGRNSLPLNIMFSPENPKGEILPSVLTKTAVRAAVARAL